MQWRNLNNIPFYPIFYRFKIIYQAEHMYTASHIHVTEKRQDLYCQTYDWNWSLSGGGTYRNCWRNSHFWIFEELISKSQGKQATLHAWHQINEVIEATCYYRHLMYENGETLYLSQRKLFVAVPSHQENHGRQIHWGYNQL